MRCGYDVSGSHAAKLAIKTNAPSNGKNEKHANSGTVYIVVYCRFSCLSRELISLHFTRSIAIVPYVFSRLGHNANLGENVSS